MIVSWRIKQYGSLAEKVPILDTLLAVAIAIIKIFVRVKGNKEHKVIGSNGGASKVFKTSDKSHLGNKDFTDGLIFIAAFRK